jgi:hypothetical protein
MLDYGLYGDEDDVKKLSMIDDVAKAQARLGSNPSRRPATR